jgi:hypothetical protein
MKSTLEDVFNDTEVLARKDFEENKNKYLTYSTLDKDISKSRTDIRGNLDIRKNGYDERIYSIAKKYGEDLEAMLAFQSAYRDDMDRLKEKYGKIKKRAYRFATLAVFGGSATVLTIGAAYLGTDCHVEMLDHPMIPMFVGLYLALVPMVIEHWRHPLGNLLLKPYGNKIKNVLSNESELKQESLSKARKYIDRKKRKEQKKLDNRSIFRKIYDGIQSFVFEDAQ